MQWERVYKFEHNGLGMSSFGNYLVSKYCLYSVKSVKPVGSYVKQYS